MATNVEFSYIVNNQGNSCMVFNSYIIPYWRVNKDSSINYKCRHHSTAGELKVLCCASVTVLNEKIVRGLFEHNHSSLSDVIIKA